MPARSDVERPSMPEAGHDFPPDRAIAQGATAVNAYVVDCMKTPLDMEEGDSPVSDDKAPSFAFRDLLAGGDPTEFRHLLLQGVCDAIDDANPGVFGSVAKRPR